MEEKLQKRSTQFSGVLSIYNIVVELLKKEVFPGKSLKILRKQNGSGRFPWSWEIIPRIWEIIP